MIGHVDRNTNCLFIPRMSTNFGKGPFIIVVFCGINCCGGYYSFVIQKIVLELNINSLYLLCVCVCVCMFIFGVVSIVVFVFCTLLLLLTGLH